MNSVVYVYCGVVLLGHKTIQKARLAQSVERTTLNRVVVGSIPTSGGTTSFCSLILPQHLCTETACTSIHSVPGTHSVQGQMSPLSHPLHLCVLITK